MNAMAADSFLRKSLSFPFPMHECIALTSFSLLFIVFLIPKYIAGILGIL
jgi:hypothetical protein